MSTQHIQYAVDEIADTLHTGVSLDNLSGSLIAHSNHYGHADDARVRALLSREVPADVREWETLHGSTTCSGPMVIPANPAINSVPRLCVPLIHRGVRTGLLFALLGTEPAADVIFEQVRAIREQVDLLAVALYEMASPQRAHSAEFHAACLGDGTALEALAHRLASSAPSQLHVAVSILVAEAGASPPSHSRSAHRRLCAQQAISRLAGVVESTVLETHSIVLQRPDRDTSCAQRIHDRLVAVCASEENAARRLFTGVAELGGDLQELPAAYRHAVIAAQAAAVQSEYGNVARWDDIGPYRMIGEKFAPEADGALSPLLHTLALSDPTGELTATLEKYYDSDDRMQDIAHALHLHRTSLYNRLGRIRDIIGADPVAGSVRLEMHLALKMARWQRRPCL